MAKTKATAMTLKRLRERGYEAHVVERRIPFSGRLVDLFNFADIVAIKLGEPIVAIQTTSGANHSSRLHKIRAESRAGLWIDCGGRVELWTWAKRGARGKRKLWTLREETVARETITAYPPQGNTNPTEVEEDDEDAATE